MNDMTRVIQPKSDQLNSDDLISGPRTITITDVTIRPGTEQPVSIHFEGDNGKPWKTCKSMNRVLVAAWGADAKAYIGRSVTIYRDPKVKWAGMEVGGIRISHLSHIEREMVMALTATKGKREPHKVRPLTDVPQQSKSGVDPAKVAEAINAFAGIGVELARLEAKGGPSANWSAQDLTGLENLFVAIRDGKKNANDVFPPVEEKASAFGDVEQGRTDEQHGDQFSDDDPARAKADEIIEAAGRVELKADYDRLVFDSAEHIAAMPSELADLVQGALDGAEKRLAG